MAVVIEPWAEGHQPLVVRCARPSAGPLAGHRPAEPLRLAVGLRREGWRAPVAGADPGEGGSERPRGDAAPGVVGHHPLDAHAEAREEGRRLAREGGARRAPLVGADDAEGDPARVVDDLAGAVVAGMGARRAVAAPAEAMAAAVGDAPEPLDAHAGQLARTLADAADGDARRPVAIGQAGQAVAAQDVADGRARHPDDRGQPVRPELVAGGQDRGHLLRSERPGRTLRSRGAIPGAGLPGLATGAHPLGRGLAAGPSGFRRPGHGPTVDLNAIHQELPAEHGQSRPAMCHESFPTGVSWLPTPSVRRLSPVNNLFVTHT